MEKTETNIFKTSFYLHSYDADMNAKAYPHSIMNFLLHSAWQHVDNSQFGFDALALEQNIWVLSRFKLKILDYPLWGETLSIETWGKGTDKLFALRDFAMYKEDGTKAASASSAWLILNRKTMRPQRVDKLRESFLHHPDKHEIPEKLDKIILPGVPEEREVIKTHYSDIDANKHVSSSNYLRWMLNSSDLIYSDKQLKSCEINYLSETYLNDLLSIRFICQDDIQYCSVIRRSDDVEVCRGKFLWE